MTNAELDKTFETNGKGYRTDNETLEMLTKLNDEGRDGEASLVFNLCRMTGHIVEIN